MLKIGDDWKVILQEAWSVRLMAVALLFTGLEAAIPMVLYKASLSDVWQAVVTGCLVAAAFLARFVVQKELG